MVRRSVVLLAFVMVMLETAAAFADRFADMLAAAKSGLADAQFNVGAMYYTGEGVSRNYAEAFYWYRRAAEQGHSGAQNNLAWMYENGQVAGQNKTEALKLYRMAAEKGNAMAQYNMGRMYHNGIAVGRDYTEASRWYRMAAENGSELAQKALRDIPHNVPSKTKAEDDNESQNFISTLDIISTLEAINNAISRYRLTSTSDAIRKYSDAVRKYSEIPEDEVLANTIKNIKPQYDRLGASSAEAPKPAPASKSNVVQDIYEYAGAKLNFGGANISDGKWVRSFKGNASAFNVLSSYVSAMTSGNRKFKLNHEYRKVYENSKSKSIYMRGPDKTFWSVTLTYTGTSNLGGKIKQQFDEKYSGEIMIYCIIEGSRMEGQIYVAKGLEVEDLGLRSDGTVVSVKKPGQSLNSTLRQNRDGSFSTSDGNFTVSLGEAAVKRDGKMYTTQNVSIVRNQGNSKEEITIQNYYRNECVTMTFPLNSLLTGDMFDRKKLGISSKMEQYARNTQSLFGLVHNYTFGTCHSGKYFFAHPDPINDFLDVVVKVMLWDVRKGAAVFYFACKFDSEPYHVEGLAAMNLKNAPSQRDSDRNSANSSGSSSNSQNIPHSNFSTIQTCSACGGTGKVFCTVCGGTGGKYEYSTAPKYGTVYTGRKVWVSCPNFLCRDGKVECRRCNGTGHI